MDTYILIGIWVVGNGFYGITQTNGRSWAARFQADKGLVREVSVGYELVDGLCNYVGSVQPDRYPHAVAICSKVRTGDSWCSASILFTWNFVV